MSGHVGQCVAVAIAAMLSLSSVCDRVLAQPLESNLQVKIKKLRDEARNLRKRIAQSTRTDSAFWQMIKRLEAMSPADTKVAVIQHPGARVVYTYRKVGDLAVADEDIVLGPYDRVVVEQARLRGDSPGVTTFAVVTSERSQWWPTNEIPFEIDSGLESRARNAVRDAIADFEQKTPLKFRERTEDDDAFVKYVKQLECCGPLGHLSSMTDHVGMRGGENTVKLQTIRANGDAISRGDLKRGALHETSHILGFYHEHVRPDRDDFIRIDEDCIDFWYGLAGNFSIESESKTIGPYDFDSIMHYPSREGEKGPPWDRKTCVNMVKRAAFRDPGDSVGMIAGGFELTAHDVNAIHHMYGREGVLGRGGDSFGFRLLTHDFDGDGFLDLAVGAPSRKNRRGSVYLYKGTASGYVLWKVLTPSASAFNASFGWSLAAGDFDGDGVQDLAVGAPRARVGGKSQAGKVYLFRIRGDSESDQFDVLTKPESGGNVEVMDRFGWSLASGYFFEQSLNDNSHPRTQLAIGVPGARDGDRGRTGRVWIFNADRESRFNDVRVPGAGSPKFGQFGFSMVSVDLRSAAGFSSERLLVISAPGVTFGGCGDPRLYRTRVSLVSLETTQAITNPNAASPSPSCPQDPNLSDAIDAYPSPVWDAGFGSVMAAADFDGDDVIDLAVNGSGRVNMYRGLSGSFEHLGAVRASDFSGESDDFSFGSAIAAGDLSGNGRAELLVGAPLKSIDGRENVGKVYVYGGCVPRAPSARQPRGQCLRSVNPWFLSHQAHSQVVTVPLPFGGVTQQTLTVSSNRSNDRFGMSLTVAAVPRRNDTEFTYLVGSPDNAFDGEPKAGAVFQFSPSISEGNPPYRNTVGINQSFETKLRRR